MITLGNYQLAQGVSYIAEHKETGEFQLALYTLETGLIKLQIKSRHVSSKTYKVYIKYCPFGTDNESILGYYCDCKCGSRTVGCCVHVASTILYLSNLRYDSKEYLPAKKLNSLLFNIAEVSINDVSDED